MKTKIYLPFAGDSPGGCTRRQLLRALVFLMLLAFASPRANAYNIVSSEVSFINMLQDEGYIEVYFP